MASPCRACRSACSHDAARRRPDGFARRGVFSCTGARGVGAGGKALSCGVECDGGSLSVRVKNNQSLLVDIPDSVRMFDPTDNGDAEGDEADLPKGARFGSDDKIFRLDRTSLKDCLPVMFDEEQKAKVISGAITE